MDLFHIVFIIIGDSWEPSGEKYIFQILSSFWSTLEQISIWSLWSTALTEDCSHLVCFIYILVLPCFFFFIYLILMLRLYGKLFEWRFFDYSSKLWSVIDKFPLFPHVQFPLWFILTFGNNEWAIFSVNLCW